MDDDSSSASAPAIDLQDIQRRFGAAPVLRGLSLKVERGECVALLGANGAGKSTLLRTLAGLLRADSGRVEVLGYVLPGGSALRRRIGYLGHDAFLYRDLNATENLAFYARLFGVRDHARAVSLLAQVGLEHVATRRVGTFSRGMQQRLGLARALLHQPDLLLLDEPLTGLDPQGADVLSSMLVRLRGQGVTVIMATHDIPRALESATRAVILGRGRVGWDSAGAPLPNSAAITAHYQSATGAR